MTEVIRDPAIMGGEPTVGGTRILADTIRSYLRHGTPAEEIFRDYPSLPVDGVDAVARWAEATYGADWRAQTFPPFPLEHYELDRVPGETDEEYASRRSMFESIGRSVEGGRAMSTADLTDEEMDAIRQVQVPAEHDYDYEEAEEPKGDPKLSWE